MFERLLLDFIARTYHNAAHSVFSPSGSYMWLNCPGSLIPNLLAKDEAGFEAAEGTVAHAIGENWLKTDERPDHLIGTAETVREGSQVFVIEITKDMLDYVQDYVDWCRYLPGDLHVEKRVQFSQLTPIPNQGGTADHFACQPGHLIITDLKYGLGVPVYAYRNPQAMLYALGVLYDWDWLYDFEKITIRIAQPRRDHFDEWETDRETLLEFAERVRVGAKNAWRLNAPLSPSEDACRWCKVKGACPAYLAVADRLADECFDDLDEPVTQGRAAELVDDVSFGLFAPEFKAPALLSTDNLINIAPYGGVFDTWFKEVGAELERRALDGGEIPGFKLVESTTHRVFASERQAAELLEKAGVQWFNLYSTKMVSPSQAEDLLRKIGYRRGKAVEYLDAVVAKPPGKPILVPVTDKRPEYVSPADTVFDDIE